jgi:hypothetical protein
MPTKKYLFLHRSPAEPQQQAAPSPSQMQEMFAAFNAWKEKFKDRILDMGDKLKPGGKIVSAAGVSDGPFVESKEIVGGYMIVTADTYEEAVEVATGMGAMMMPGARIEIREIAGH